MIVNCPHCETRYVLPEALVGTGGARVRCPRCREPFSVDVKGRVVETPAESAETSEVPAPAPAMAVMTGEAFLAAPSVAVTASATVEAAPGVTAEPDEDPARASTPEAPEGNEDAAAPAGEARRGAPGTPAEVACAVLDELAAHSGEAIAKAQAEGRVFREFGPVIAEAFEFYRREVGPGADPAPFRAALKARWDVDLEPRMPQSRLG
jgi:predicted Zn finger-like uncharacterized protein